MAEEDMDSVFTSELIGICSSFISKLILLP